MALPFSVSSGFLLINKPSGPTSHDVVMDARRQLSNRKIGHCGTLDPLASGLLILCVGEAVKWQDRLTSQRKTYRGIMRLGLSTDTDDISGQLLHQETKQDPGLIPSEKIRKTFSSFLGEQDQRVPRYSAVKVNGSRLYELARKGEIVELPVRRVSIDRYDYLGRSAADLAFFVDCSKGTYIRSLVRDTGEKLGVGATLLSLSRESIGPLTRSQAVPWPAERRAKPPDLTGRLMSLEDMEALGVAAS